MKEKIKILVAYCSEAFKEKALPLIASYADKSNRTELKFECDRVGPQDEWEKLLDAFKPGDFTHCVIDRRLRGFMTTNQFKILKTRAYKAKIMLKLQSPNGGLDEKELAAEIGKFFVPDVGILSDLVRGDNCGSDENEED